MIALIVAYDKNRVIGKNGRIPWTLANEKKRFKDLTTGNAVIMGRRTYEEIGKPLPNRLNIVVSRTQNFDAENCVTVSSVQEALAVAGDREMFVSGGERIYRELLPFCSVLYVTEIDATFDGDAFFPTFDESAFDKTVEWEYHEEYTYRYMTYRRKENIQKV